VAIRRATDAAPGAPRQALAMEPHPPADGTTTAAVERASAEPQLSASARSLGGSLRHEISVGQGRHVLLTDEPARLGGTDTAPAPHELLPAALAGCISTTMLMYALNRGWDIGDVRVDVEYFHRSAPRRFEIVVHLDPSIPPARVARLTKVAESCPVRRAIEGGIEFDERIVQDAA
jgi:putative redox protein